MPQWTPGDLVDPTSSEWDRRVGRSHAPRRPPHAATIDPAALVALSLEVAPLRDLVEWPPVGGLLEGLAEAAAGDGGLTRRDTDRMRRWSKRWARLAPRLRGFYRATLQTLSYFKDLDRTRRMEQQAVHKALWRIFEGYELPGWAHGALRSLWEEHEGSLPMYHLAPRGDCGTSQPQHLRDRKRAAVG